MGSIAKVVPGVPITDPKVDISTERAVVASTTPLDIGVIEMTLAVVLPIVPTTAKEEEV